MFPQMPDLVARLSGLHATLTSRLALQESLLSLSGRLDMVISQIEMRSSAAPAPLVVPQATKGSKRKKRPQKKAVKYVEGESEEEEMEVGVESEEDAGSVEDIELGGSEDEEDEDAEVSNEEEGEDDEEDDDEEDDDDSDEAEGSKLNGFVDDEAEEEYTDEEDDESE